MWLVADCRSRVSFFSVSSSSSLSFLRGHDINTITPTAKQLSLYIPLYQIMLSRGRKIVVKQSLQRPWVSGFFLPDKRNLPLKKAIHLFYRHPDGGCFTKHCSYKIKTKINNPSTCQLKLSPCVSTKSSERQARGPCYASSSSACLWMQSFSKRKCSQLQVKTWAQTHIRIKGAPKDC